MHLVHHSLFPLSGHQILMKHHIINNNLQDITLSLKETWKSLHHLPCKHAYRDALQINIQKFDKDTKRHQTNIGKDFHYLSFNHLYLSIQITTKSKWELWNETQNLHSWNSNLQSPAHAKRLEPFKMKRIETKKRRGKHHKASPTDTCQTLNCSLNESWSLEQQTWSALSPWKHMSHRT